MTGHWFGPSGGYPQGFLERAYELLHSADPDAVLHLCSGSVQRGIRLDVRAEKRPTSSAGGSGSSIATGRERERQSTPMFRAAFTATPSGPYQPASP